MLGGSLRRSIERISGFSCSIAGLLVLLVTVVIVGEMLSRNIFLLGWRGSVDAVSVVLVVVVFFSIPALLLANRQLEIDILTNHMAGRLAQVQRLFASLCTLGFLGLVAYFGWQESAESLEQGKRFMGYPIPLAIPWFGLALGATIGFLVELMKFYFHAEALVATRPAAPQIENSPD